MQTEQKIGIFSVQGRSCTPRINLLTKAMWLNKHIWNTRTIVSFHTD